MGTARYLNNGSAGTSTAALAFAGSPPTTAKTEEYDGTNWSEQNDMSTARLDIGGLGTQTAALGFGGTGSPFASNATEEYDGTSWTGGGNLVGVNRRLGGAGTQTAGLAFGGLVSSGTVTAVAQLYDGSAWSSTASMGTGRYYVGNAGGTQSAGICAGGLTSGSAAAVTTATEEFTGEIEALDYKTLTSS
jgi:hypothetical protein